MVCSCKFRLCAVLDGLYQNVVAINFHHDHDVLVASFGSGRKLFCLVLKYCFSDVIYLSVDESHFLTSHCLCVCFFEWYCFGFDWPDIFPGLVQVNFQCLGGIWIVLDYVALVEHWPSCEVPYLDFLDPCGFNWVPTDCMHPLYCLLCSWKIIYAVGFLEELLGLFGWRAWSTVSSCLH